MKLMKKSILTIIFILSFIQAFPQSTSEETVSKVKWYSIQEAEKLLNASPRPLFIDTFTDWCIWCKRMDANTFTNDIIADILNTKFYPVKLNAEGKEDITFMGKKFINDGKYGNAHQLAVALLQGQLSYPTSVILTLDNGKVGVSPIPGYQEPKQLETLLAFFADKAYLSKSWDDFQKGFVGKVK
jgi:thioredoxin-related protein